MKIRLLSSPLTSVSLKRWANPEHSAQLLMIMREQLDDPILDNHFRPLTSDLYHHLCSEASDDSNIHLALFSSQVFLTSQTIRSVPGLALEPSVITDDTTRSFKSSPATEPSQTTTRHRDRERGRESHTDVSTLLFNDCNRLRERWRGTNWWHLLLRHWHLLEFPPRSNYSCFRCPQCRLFMFLLNHQGGLNHIT